VIKLLYCLFIVVVKKTFRYSNVFSTTTYTSRNVFLKSGINYKELIRQWFPGSGAENYVASAEIEAVKPL
jgi:hypothetical protein